MDRQSQNPCVDPAEAAADHRQVRAVAGLRGWKWMCLALAVWAVAAAAGRSEVAQVHVDYSVTAGELVGRCREAVADGRIDQAVDLAGQLLDRHADDLVEIEPGLYQSAARVVRRMVGEWPAEAVAALEQSRSLLAVEPWSSLRDSVDIGEIQAFAQRHFLTPAGAEATERAARLAMEAGQPDVARLMVEDLLRYHPLRRQHRARWLLLHAASLQMAGRAEAAKASAGAAGGEPVDWDGRKVDAAEAARQVLAVPTGGGEPVEGDIQPKTNLTILWQASLTDQPAYALSRKEQPTHWLAAPVVLDHPAVVLAQWDRRCVAVDVGSGTTLWEYWPLPDSLATRAGVSGPSAPRRPAAMGDRVYVVTDVPKPQEEPGPVRAVHGLACLDIATGKPYWVRTGVDMMNRSEPAVLDGTPVAADGRVYLTARVIRTGGYHDIHLLKVDAGSGQLLGRTMLFGVARAEYTPNERIKPVRLGMHGGLLYAASAAGAVAAIDPHSLRPIWVRSFKPNGPVDEQEEAVREPQVPALWAEPPLMVGEQLVVPTDAALRVVDRWTGASIRTIRLDGPVMALAAGTDAGGKVAVLCKRFVQIVDIDSGATLHKLDTRKNERQIGGMCPLAGGRWLVSLADELRIVAADGANEPLAVEFLPGAIPRIVGQKVYLGCAGYLVGVGDAARSLAELEAETQAAGPAAAVRLLELALRMGRTDVAATALQRALRQGAAERAKAGTRTQQRLFQVCLAFGQHYGGKADDASRRMAEDLLAAAGRCAAGPAELILWRAATADLRVRQRRLAEAVAIWQGVLADDSLRKAALPTELGMANLTAHAWAQMRIAEAIARHGRGAYEPFDAEAEKALLAAQKARDRAAIEGMLARYPNSVHVAAAHLAIGRMVLGKGDTKGAIESLRRAATEAQDKSSTQQQAMLALAEVYERIGSREAAATWMGRLAAQRPDMVIEWNGAQTTAAELAGKMAGRRAGGASGPVRRIGGPLTIAWQQTFEDTVQLVSGAAGGPSTQPPMAWSVGFLRGIQPQTGEPAWKRPAGFKTRPTTLAGSAGLVVLHDKYRVAGIETGSGRERWSWSAKGPDPEGPLVDPEDVPAIEAATAGGEAVVVFTADKRMTCLERTSGQMRWQRTQEPALAAGVAAAAELLVYRGAQANRVAYAVVEVETGKRVSLWQPSRNVPAEAIEMLPSAVVMLIGANNVEGYDARSGALLWQVGPRQRFRTAVRLLEGTTLYIADGDRHVTKIDTLTGKALWRTELKGRAGPLVRLIAEGERLWVVGERGCHVLEEQTGQKEQTVLLPREAGAGVEIREAAACEMGLVCLAAGRGAAGKAAPAVVVFEKGKGAATVLAKVEAATGIVSGWDVGDGELVIAAGSRIVGLSTQATAGKGG